MAKLASRDVELEPIDRLEEKVKLLVAMVERMKADQARADEENSRLSRDLEAMHERVHAAEATAVELTALRSERDAIRTRVTDMLDQLEGLSL
jgi:regulator of replication initiation timing